MKTFRWTLCAAGIAALLAPGLTQAQVVRESGVKSVAGVLYTQASAGGGASEWTFKSSGGEILFATLDADIYRKKSAHTPEAAPTAPSASGCSEDDEGGPGLFVLKVLDAYGHAVCEASRPAPPPGWQRDPRMACLLPGSAVPLAYTLRVELTNADGEQLQPAYPFLLNISLRKVAPNGVNLQAAIAASSTGGF